MIIILYNILSTVFLPFHFLLGLYRIAISKESILSLSQKLGFSWPKLTPSTQRIWIHAASVGECVVAMNLVEMLKKDFPEAKFLISICTKAAYEMLEKNAASYVEFMFIPVDSFFIVQKFMRYCKPQASIFIEAELWPGIISQISKISNSILVNARMSDKSYQRWRKFPILLRSVAQNFCQILTQSQIDYEKYKSFGLDNVSNIGNIKFTNSKLPIDQEKLEVLAQCDWVRNNNIFLAASTHKEDEDIIFPIIKQLRRDRVKIIMVLRHIGRINEVSILCQNMDLKYSIRSKSPIPKIDDDIYIVDSLGEMGLFINLADIVFVGGSFAQGGHNLLEPAYFGKVIICGPRMSNYREITNNMQKKNAVIVIKTTQDLLHNIKFLYSEGGAEEAAIYRENALNFTADQNLVYHTYRRELKKYIAGKNSHNNNYD